MTERGRAPRRTQYMLPPLHQQPTGENLEAIGCEWII
jgi:hypothetical protein